MHVNNYNVGSMGMYGYGLVLMSFVFCCYGNGLETNETLARQFLGRYESEAEEVSYQNSLKAWAYNTNITDYNSDQLVRQFSYLSLRI